LQLLMHQSAFLISGSSTSTQLLCTNKLTRKVPFKFSTQELKIDSWLEFQNLDLACEVATSRIQLMFPSTSWSMPTALSRLRRKLETFLPSVESTSMPRSSTAAEVE